MQLIGSGGPLQLNYHGRPPAKPQITLAWQQFRKLDCSGGRRSADVKLFLSPQATKCSVASTAATGSKSVDLNKRLWCRARLHPIGVRNASLNPASDQLKSTTTNIDDLLEDRRRYRISCQRFVRKSWNDIDDVIGGQWWKYWWMWLRVIREEDWVEQCEGNERMERR